MEVKITRSLGLIAILLVLQNGGCNHDGSVNPPTSPEPLEGDFGIWIDIPSGFTSEYQAPVVLRSQGADSVTVWNEFELDGSNKTTFFLSDSLLTLSEWELNEGEGPKIVSAIFFNSSDSHSTVVSDTVIVDQTPPFRTPVMEFPAIGGVTPNAVRFSWGESADQWCPEHQLKYTIRIEEVNGTSGKEHTGNDTHYLGGDFQAGQSWEWSLKSVDMAGNESEESTGIFHVWEIDLPVFRAIPSGSFTMGSPSSEYDSGGWESQYSVVLTKPFLCADKEIAFKQLLPVLQWAFEAGKIVVEPEGVFNAIGSDRKKLISFVTYSPIDFTDGVFSYIGQSDERIAAELTWYGAVAFCDWLNELAGLAPVYDTASSWSTTGNVYESRGYRLPTEAEWEYACRAGSITAFSNGEMSNPFCHELVLDEIGWYCGNMDQFQYLPGMKIPNSWGLFDMHGGRAEWCYDWANEYPGFEVVDPVSEVPSYYRVLRGGGWVFLSMQSVAVRGLGLGDTPILITGQVSGWFIRDPNPENS